MSGDDDDGGVTVLVASRWSSDEDCPHAHDPIEDEGGVVSADRDFTVASDGQRTFKETHERRGRPKDRTRAKRKGGSHSVGRASSIDFIRKVPVSPFHRDSSDMHYDSLERHPPNHMVRTRSKSSSHVIAAHALFSNSSHNKSEIKAKAKATRTISDSFFDSQIPPNYVRNLARRFQSQDAVTDSENNVVLVSLTETDVGRESNPSPRYEADNQISYIEVCAEPPMSISSTDSDSTRDLESPVHNAKVREQQNSSNSASSASGIGAGSRIPNNETDLCSTGSAYITPSHATPSSSATTFAASVGQESSTAKHSRPHSQTAGKAYHGKACGSGNVQTSGSSDSGDSIDNSKSVSTSSSRPGYVRGRHKSYLRDTMQFSFYTGEKSESSSGNRLGSDDGIYMEPGASSQGQGYPGSPMISDVSTSGCSSGSDDPPRGRWPDGSHACPSNFGSYLTQNQRGVGGGLCSASRGHVHTSGCYGPHRQRSVSPDKRETAGYSEPVRPPHISRSLPALPVLSSMTSAMDGLASPLAPVAPSLVPVHDSISSKYSKDPKGILRAAHLSNELVRLTQLLERLHPQELQHLICQRLRQRDSKAIVALGIILPRTSFPSIDQVHCVRCHKSYDNRQSSACTLKHPAAYVMKTGQDSRGASFYCKACDGQFVLQGLYSYDEKINSYRAGFCFNGQHSTNPDDVNFSGIVRTCEEQGCVECYV